MATSDAGSGSGNATTMPDFGLPPGPLPTGDRGPAINAVQVLMIVLATSSVVLRFIARRMTAAGLWWDDWVILAALILSLGINFLNLVAVQTGLGQHIWNVKDHGQAYLQSLFALEVLYTTALALNKLGVLLMYQRLFGIERKLTIAVKIVAAIVVAWWFGVEVVTLVQCHPVDKFWNYAKEGYCIDIVAFFEGSAIPNVIIDVAILLLPQPILWKLRMSMSNKIALCGIFLLGAFTAISSIGRLVAIVDFRGAVDFTWTAFGAIIWYSLEPAIGIICACLPCLGPIFRKLPGSPFATQKSNAESRYPSQGPSGQLSDMRSKASRRLSLDTASVAKLTQTESSYQTSVYASASGSVDDIGHPPGTHELNVIHVRNSTHVTSPISP